MSTDYGRSYGMSTHDAGIDRPGHRKGDRIDDSAELTESKAQDMADQARQTVSGAAEVVQSTVEGARSHFRSAVDQARGKMSQYREQGWGRVQGDVVEYTRSQPLAALGTAVAIGVLLGWLSSTARRSG